MDDKTQLAIYEKAKAFVPSLQQAVREKLPAKQQEKLLQVFRMVDTKKPEMGIFFQAKSMDVSKPERIKKPDGNIIVINKVLNSRNITFLVKKLGRDEVVAVIRLLLANVNEYFNRKKFLTTSQTIEIAEQIIDECGDTMYLDELIYIFKKAKISAKVFDGIDGNMIFRWIDEHYVNREEQMHKKHLSDKYTDYTATYADDLVKKFAVVPEKKEKAYMDRDNKAKGIVDEKPITRTKWKPKKESK